MPSCVDVVRNRHAAFKSRTAEQLVRAPLAVFSCTCKLLQARTQNQEAKAVIEALVSDASLKPTLSQHYFGDRDHVEQIKTLLHSMSNGGSPDEWRREHGAFHADPAFIVTLHRVMAEVTAELAEASPDAVRWIAERFPKKDKRVPNPQRPGKYKIVTVPRDPAKCWKSFLLQQDEALGLLSKMRAATALRLQTGPPLHDCLFVEKSGDAEEVATAMAHAVEDATWRAPLSTLFR